VQYRILDNLRFSKKPRILKGEVSGLKGLSPEQIRILLKRGAISEVASPPLSILPGWGRRWPVFKKAGIEDINQLLSADLDSLSKELRISVETLQHCAEEAKGWLSVSKEVSNYG